MNTMPVGGRQDRKSTRLHSSHVASSYAGFCLKKKNCSELTLRARANGQEMTSHQRANLLPVSRDSSRLQVSADTHNDDFLCGSIRFFFNDTATTEIYTLSLHDALPIFDHCHRVCLAWIYRFQGGEVLIHGQ